MSDKAQTDRWQENAATQRARFTAYTLDPAHTITLEPFGGLARILWQGVVIAESQKAITLLERNNEPVIYFPQTDVRQDLLGRTDHATHCPYKGDASYWSLKDAGKVAENAVWAYESPIPVVSGIAGLMAFYLDSMGKDFGLTLENN